MTSARSLALACLLLLAAAVLWPQAALAQEQPADPPGRVGRLAELKGSVWVFDAEQGEWQAAVRNRPLTSGDRLATDADSRAEIRIGSTVLRVGAGSELQVLQLDDERLRFYLQGGSLALRLRSRETAVEAELLTAEGRLLPVRAGHYRIDRSDRHEGESFAGVLSGEATLDLGGYLVPLAAGQGSQFWLEGRDPARRVGRSTGALLPDDEFAAWVDAADRRDAARLAQPYVSPEMTGAEDLDRYGRWDTHPEYGPLWFPTVVAPGWAPYQDGRWVYVQPWGWTWVDAAPWGFAPFHYGRWVSWQGRWGWAPGPYVQRPVYAPALVGWAGAPGHRRDDDFRGHRPLPGSSWVPLAPRESYRPHYEVSPIYIERINGRAPLPPPRFDERGGRGERGQPDRGDRPDQPARPGNAGNPGAQGGTMRPPPVFVPMPATRPQQGAGAAPERPQRPDRPEQGSPTEPFRDGRTRPPAAEPPRTTSPTPTPAPQPPALQPIPKIPGGGLPPVLPVQPRPVAPPPVAERPAPPKAEPAPQREHEREHDRKNDGRAQNPEARPGMRDRQQTQ